MRIVASSSTLVLVCILVLASCKSAMHKPYFGFRDGLRGNVDSTIIYSYKKWDDVKREGGEMYEKMITRYTPLGNVEWEGKWALNHKGTWIKVGDERFRYDDRGEKVQVVSTKYDVNTGAYEQTNTDVLLEKTEGAERWEKIYASPKDTSVLVSMIKRENRLEKIYLVENEKETFYMSKEYTAKDQLKSQQVRVMTVGMHSNFEYHPRWNFVHKERTAQSFAFSELTIYTNKDYAYTELDDHKNWTHRVIIDSDNKEKAIYQRQEVFYRK